MTNDEIKEAVVKNLPLVRQIAGVFYQGDPQFEDLVQDGVIGLIRALQKFDPSKGFALSTYATPHIRAAMSRCKRRMNSLVKTPPLYRYKESMLTPGARKSTRLAYQLGVLVISLDDSNQVSNNYEGGAPRTLLDTLPAPDESPEDAAERSCILDAIDATISCLPARDQFIVREYLYRNKNYREIGDQIGLCRERIRQILDICLKKIRRELT